MLFPVPHPQSEGAKLLGCSDPQRQHVTDVTLEISSAFCCCTGRAAAFKSTNDPGRLRALPPARCVRPHRSRPLCFSAAEGQRPSVRPGPAGRLSQRSARPRPANAAPVPAGPGVPLCSAPPAGAPPGAGAGAARPAGGYGDGQRRGRRGSPRSEPLPAPCRLSGNRKNPNGVRRACFMFSFIFRDLVCLGFFFVKL